VDEKRVARDEYWRLATWKKSFDFGVVGVVGVGVEGCYGYFC